MNNLVINLAEELAIINILVEVCYGLYIEDFEKKFGVEREIVEAFLNRLSEDKKNGVIQTQISESESKIILKAFQEVQKEIEEWEFHARIGMTMNEVNALPIIQKISSCSK